MKSKAIWMAVFAGLTAVTVSPTEARATALSVTPATLAFPDQDVGTVSAALSFTVRNDGAEPVIVGAMTLLGADATQFLVPSNECHDKQLAPGGTCVVKFRFAPTRTGLRSATLTIYDIAAETQVSVVVTGDGTGTLTYAAPHYEIIDLNALLHSLGAGPEVWNDIPGLAALNNRGQIALNLQFKECPNDNGWASYQRGYVLNPVTSTLTAVGVLPGALPTWDDGCNPTSLLRSLNNVGQAVGVATYGTAGGRHPILYRDAVLYDIVDLVTSGGPLQSQGADHINDAGQIFLNGNGYWGPGVLFDNGALSEMSLLRRPELEVGDVLGGSFFFDYDAVRFVYIAPLNLIPDRFHQKVTYAGNGVGLTNARLAGPGSIWAMSFQNGVAFDLGVANGDITAMNASGLGVGRLYQNPEDLRFDRFTIVWDRVFGARKLSMLLPPGWTLEDYPLANDAGEILTAGLDAEGTWHALLLRPVVTTPAGSDVAVQSGQVTLTFDSISSGGTTTAKLIDASTAVQVPGGFAVSDSFAYEISTTATFSGPITLAFKVPGPISEADFNNLQVLHNENGQLVDVTATSPPRDYETLTIYAVTSSLSPFYLARVGNRVNVLFDQTKAHKAGSTVPIKLQLLDAAGHNLSSASTPLSVRSVLRLGDSVASTVIDSGNANADQDFRYDSSVGGTGGYVFNLSTKALAQGTYSLSFYVGRDRAFTYTLQFQVK